jgi:hypothetical protein
MRLFKHSSHALPARRTEIHTPWKRLLWSVQGENPLELTRTKAVIDESWPGVRSAVSRCCLLRGCRLVELAREAGRVRVVVQNMIRLAPPG